MKNGCECWLREQAQYKQVRDPETDELLYTIVTERREDGDIKCQRCKQQLKCYVELPTFYAT